MKTEELTDKELKDRAALALHLEEQGTPLDEALNQANQLIACRRAFGMVQHGDNNDANRT